MWTNFRNATFVPKTYLIVTGHAEMSAFSNSLVQTYFLVVSLFYACTRTHICTCFLKARFETRNDIIKRKEEIFGETAFETALELIENRIWTLDLKNKATGLTHLASEKLNLPSLLFSFSGREQGGEAFRST